MSFTNIIGQDRAIRLLRSMIEKDETSGAHLFVGPDGVGKRSLSMEFAKAINCEKKRPGCMRRMHFVQQNKFSKSPGCIYHT